MDNNSTNFNAALFGAASGVTNLETYFAFREDNYRFCSCNVGGYHSLLSQFVDTLFADVTNSDSEEKLRKRIGGAQLHILPENSITEDGRSLEAELKYLDQRFRKVMLTGADSEGKMTVKQMEENIKEGETVRNQFFVLKDYINDHKDEFLCDFEQEMVNAVSGLALTQRKKDELVQTMVAKAKAGLNTGNWYMNYRVMMPSTKMEEDIKAMIFQPVVEVAKVICTALKSFKEKSYINGKIVNHLAVMTHDLEENNKADNPFVKSLITDLKDLVNGNDDYKSEVLTDALVDIMAYADNIGYKLDSLELPYSEVEMQNLLDLRTNQITFDDLGATPAC